MVTSDAAASADDPLNGTFLISHGQNPAEPQRELGKAVPEQIDHEIGGNELTSPQLILDKSHLLPFRFLRVGDRIGRAVVKLERGDGASGTGFLVAPDILLTNNHVLPDIETAKAARAVANYETSAVNSPAESPITALLRPEMLFVTNAALDFTFCAVSGLDEQGAIAMERNSLGVLKGELVNIIQHPRGRPKEIALQDNEVVKADNLILHYCCDTEPGSSGSPVFDNRWKLVALHHASVSSPAQGHRALGVDPEGKFLNEGIRLSAIALWLDTGEAELLGQERVARLRSLFQGLDPQIGFFGALGRNVPSADAAAFVVDAYRGRNDNLDLAYWDLRALGHSVRDRLTELGWLLADLGIDVWCLAGPSTEHAKLLCELIEMNSRIECRCLTASPAFGTPLTVLYRTRNGLSVEMTEVGPMPGARLQLRGADPLRKAGSMLLIPVAPHGQKNHLDEILAGPLLATPEPVILIGGAGHEVDSTRISTLAAIAPSAQIATGINGFLAIFPGSSGNLGVREVFVSSKLIPRFDPSGRFQILLDRNLPAELSRLTGCSPVVARLILG